jgi:hypothetical protein
MSSKPEIFLSKDFDKWEDFLQKEEAGNIFQSPVMIPAYVKALKFNAYLLTAQLNQEIVGGILIYKRFPPKLPVHLINELDTSYGSIVTEEIMDDVKIKVIQMLLENAKKMCRCRYN